jgi:hypothetical protein
LNTFNVLDSNTFRTIEKYLFKSIHHTDCVAYYKFLRIVSCLIIIEVQCNNGLPPVPISNVKYGPNKRGIGRDFSDEAPVYFVGHDAAYVGICLIDIADAVIIWEVGKRREISLFEN